MGRRRRTILKQEAERWAELGAQNMLLWCEAHHAKLRLEQVSTAWSTFVFIHISRPTGLGNTKCGLQKGGILGQSPVCRLIYQECVLSKNLTIDVIRQMKQSKLRWIKIIFDEAWLEKTHSLKAQYEYQRV